MRALRLFTLAQWGHDPEHVQEEMKAPYRLFLYACADAYLLQQTASLKPQGSARSSSANTMA